MRGAEVTATDGVETGLVARGIGVADASLAQEDRRTEIKKRILNRRVMMRLYRIASAITISISRKFRRQFDLPSKSCCLP